MSKDVSIDVPVAETTVESEERSYPATVTFFSNGEWKEHNMVHGESVRLDDPDGNPLAFIEIAEE